MQDNVRIIRQLELNAEPRPTERAVFSRREHAAAMLAVPGVRHIFMGGEDVVWGGGLDHRFPFITAP